MSIKIIPSSIFSLLLPGNILSGSNRPLQQKDTKLKQQFRLLRTRGRLETCSQRRIRVPRRDQHRLSNNRKNFLKRRDLSTGRNTNVPYSAYAHKSAEAFAISRNDELLVRFCGFSIESFALIWTNCSMLRLVEDGEMYRLRRFWDARKPECIQSAKKTTIHVGIKEFSCALVVFGLGIVFSVVLLVFEMVSHYKRLRGKVKRPVMGKNTKADVEVKGVIIPYTN